MKYKSLLLAAAPVVLLAACASGPQPAAVVANCTFPDAPDIAVPDWVCGMPVAGIAISAVGIAQPTSAGVSHQTNIAEADGRAKLGKEFESQVQNMTKTYIGTTGIGDSETVDKVTQDVTKTVSNQTLYGSKKYNTRVSPNGVMYVLMGMSETNTRKAVAEVVADSMDNDQALWQEFKAQQGFDEMAEAIANQPIVQSDQ